MQELEILISIQPDWIEKIAQLIKTIEVRKTRPALKPPFKCRIYCTQDKYKHLYDLRPYSNGDITLSVTTHNKHSLVPNNYLNGKVVGEFICDKITRYNCDKDFDEYFVAGYVGAYMPLKEMCLTNKDLMEYGKGKPLYGWHISDLKIYEKPKELSNFKTMCRDAYCRYGEWYCKDGYGSCAVRDKEKDFPYNDECIYFDCPTYGECCEYEDYAYCNCNGLKPVIRPPQSFYYVKE